LSLEKKRAGPRCSGEAGPSDFGDIRYFGSNWGAVQSGPRHGTATATATATWGGESSCQFNHDRVNTSAPVFFKRAFFRDDHFTTRYSSRRNAPHCDGVSSQHSSVLTEYTAGPESSQCFIRTSPDSSTNLWRPSSMQYKTCWGQMYFLSTCSVRFFGHRHGLAFPVDFGCSPFPCAVQQQR
jgi:hypothetical protein